MPRFENESKKRRPKASFFSVGMGGSERGGAAAIRASFSLRVRRFKAASRRRADRDPRPAPDRPGRPDGGSGYTWRPARRYAAEAARGIVGAAGVQGVVGAAQQIDIPHYPASCSGGARGSKKGDAGTHTGAGDHFKPSLVAFHDPAGNGQTQSGAPRFSGPGTGRSGKSAQRCGGCSQEECRLPHPVR